MLKAVQIGVDRVNVSVNVNDILVKDGVVLDDININDGTITVSNSTKEGRKVFSITIPKLFNDTNEKNIPIEQVGIAIEKAQELLATNGVIVDIGNSYLSSFEINANINDRKLYDTIETIAKSNIFNKQKVYKAENGEGIQSLMIPKSKYKTKIYKKSEHLQETGQQVVDEHLVRFEIVTKDWTQKQRLLGNDITLNSMIANSDRIIDWYKVCIRETIKKPVEMYLKQLEFECLTKLNEGTKPSQVINDLMFMNKLVDLIVFDNAMKRHYKATGKKKPQTVIKSNHNRLRKMNEKRYSEVVNNVETLQNVYESIGI